jgi:hypothetical protein
MSHLNATKDGKTAQRDHSMSNGLVDGKKHEVSNKERCDRAICCSSDDQVEAKQGLDKFLCVFDVESKSVEEIADLGFHTKSLKVFQSMTFIEPGESLPSEYCFCH